MRVGVLGPLELRDSAGRPARVAGPRLRALAVRLAIDVGRVVPADVLAEDLWPDGGAAGRPSHAPNALQALVSRLRQAAGREIVAYQTGGYRLGADPAEVDAVAFERQVSAARALLADQAADLAARGLREALALWRGPALIDAAALPFAAGPAARLEELRLAATEDLIDAELALGRGAALVPLAEELASANPLRERLRGLLMRALCAAGRQADALAAFEETRRMLADQLGVDPSPALSAVHLAILRGDRASDAAAGGRHDSGRTNAPVPAPPPAATQPARQPPAGLPAPFTSFVGREDERRQLVKLLSEARLVTLTGPGGAGKTRLAVESAAQLAEGATDGVWFVPLAPLGESAGVPGAVLAALGVPEGMRLTEAPRLPVPPLSRLAEVLAAKRLVLILDNCEHVVSAVAVLAATVLAAAPGVRILATSREPLAITGEAVFPVPPLALPPEGASAAEAAGYAAVRLLADRAAAVRPGFAVTDVNAADVITICRALDGIPLALELAAARLRTLTPGQVAGRLGDRFRLLSAGSRSVLPRHQTLRAVVDWSWDLLDDTERAVLRRLSVFSGSATPEAAGRVCLPEAVRAGEGQVPDIVDVIAALADKSLVNISGGGDPADDGASGGVRYWLLETVRAYAAERLAEAGEDRRVRDAHARYFLGLAERAEPRLRSRDQIRWLDILSAEHRNCSAALRHAISTRDAALALRLVAALSWFWIMRNHDSEVAQWAAAARNLSPDCPPPGLAEAHALCGVIAAGGQFSPGARDGGSGDDGGGGDDGGVPEAARATAPDTSPPHVHATARVVRALQDALARVPAKPQSPLLALARPLAAMLAGDVAAARRGLARLAAHPDPWTRAMSLAVEGHLAMNNGDLEQAAAALSRAKAAFRDVGDRWGLGFSLAGEAEVAMARGDPAAAVGALQHAREQASEVAASWAEMLLIPLARARAAAGDTEGARADLERGVRAAARFGQLDDEAAGYLELAELARRDGRLVQARELADRARKIAESRPGRPDMGLVAMRAFSKLGCVAEQSGDLAAAERWHDKALRAACAAPPPFGPAGPALAELLTGPAALAAARGDDARAAELLGLADRLRGFLDPASPEVARATAAASATLGERGFAAAYRSGWRRTEEDIPALALTR